MLPPPLRHPLLHPQSLLQPGGGRLRPAAARHPATATLGTATTTATTAATATAVRRSLQQLLPLRRAPELQALLLRLSPDTAPPPPRRRITRGCRQCTATATPLLPRPQRRQRLQRSSRRSPTTTVTAATTATTTNEGSGASLRARHGKSGLGRTRFKSGAYCRRGARAHGLVSRTGEAVACAALSFTKLGPCKKGGQRDGVAPRLVVTWCCREAARHWSRSTPLRNRGETSPRFSRKLVPKVAYFGDAPCWKRYRSGSAVSCYVLSCIRRSLCFEIFLPLVLFACQAYVDCLRAG